MKKIVSAVFVFLFLFNIAGYYLWFGLQRYEIRKDVKTEIKKRMRLKKEALTLIIISEENKNEVLWIKIGKEFKYRGALYDVVSFEQKNGKKYYYCINDVKEKQLIEQFLKTHKTSERSS
ncbi:MAG: hypothetical protein GXO50_04415, partial [Chlorobi bacterium]|nr:hypothetical protein [Chlorobiota bacterium]